MYLSSQSIHKLVSNGVLVVEPFCVDCLKPASYVLHLGHGFRRWKPQSSPIDMWGSTITDEHLEPSFESDSITIQSGEFLLGQTMEKISLPNNVAGVISPLSHIARFGLTIHGRADWINPGFGMSIATPLTLELRNDNPSSLLLRASMPIAHLKIVHITSENISGQHKQSIYEGKDPLTSPLLHEEWAPGSVNKNVR